MDTWGRRGMLGRLMLMTTASAGLVVWRARDAQAHSIGDAILGLWSVHVAGSGGSYNYFYSFARGGYTATGDVDEKYGGMKFSPTMGAYVAAGLRDVRYHEAGWVYDLTGKSIGTFNGVGTFVLDRSGETLNGPGVFKVSDLKGNVLSTEPYVAKGKKISI